MSSLTVSPHEVIDRRSEFPPAGVGLYGRADDRSIELYPWHIVLPLIHTERVAGVRVRQDKSTLAVIGVEAGLESDQVVLEGVMLGLQRFLTQETGTGLHLAVPDQCEPFHRQEADMWIRMYRDSPVHAA